MSDLLMSDVGELAVTGYTVEWEDGTLAVPWIASGEPGKGHVGRYLDGLPTDRRVAFPTVLSAVLAGMLVRRGFTYSDRLIYAPEFGEWVEGFVRDPQS